MPLQVETNYTIAKARWEVMWVTVKKGEPHIHCLDFEFDFVGALKLYEKLMKAPGRKMVTLRCKNVGFPPPDKWRDIEPVYGKRKGKLVVVDEVYSDPPTYQTKMVKYNRQGVWWCPYCMQLRRFEKRAWTEIDDKMYPAEPAYCCPMCDISHRDAHVIRYNPIAQRLVYSKRTKSRGRKERKRGRRRK